MAKNNYNIKARVYMLGIKMVDLTKKIVEENPDHPQLNRTTPPKLSKAIQVGYIGSQLDELIAAEADRILIRLECEQKEREAANG